jgi:hypothetical protein
LLTANPEEFRDQVFDILHCPHVSERESSSEKQLKVAQKSFSGLLGMPIRYKKVCQRNTEATRMGMGMETSLGNSSMRPVLH